MQQRHSIGDGRLDTSTKLAEASMNLLTRESSYQNPITDSPRERLSETYSSRTEELVNGRLGHGSRAPQTFVYEPLQAPSCTRLLHVRPGREEDPMSCYIVSNYDLDFLHTIPTYWAVSYSWLGGGGFTTLECGEHELKVQMTIFHLLKRLRQSDNTIILWIDAICINQMDDSERSSQVQRMGLIYNIAEKVIAWVGDEDENTPALAELIARVPRELSHEHEKRPRVSLGELSIATSQEWTYFLQFLDKPWFTRTWVLQEVCLAQSCFLHFGSYSWEWVDLLWVLHFLGVTREGHTADLDKFLSRGVVRFCGEWDDNDRDLLSLLRSSRGTDTSLAVDRVYAVLPMANRNYGIFVNYFETPQSVFTDIAGRLAADKRIDVLHYASDNMWNNLQDLPSWVPDWTCAAKPRTLALGSESQEQYILDMRKKELEKYGWPHVIVDGALLHVEMQELDEIRVVSNTWLENQRSKHDTDVTTQEVLKQSVKFNAGSCLEEWHDLLAQLVKEKVYEPTQESLTSAFIRTLVLDGIELENTYASWDEVYEELKDLIVRLQAQEVKENSSEIRLSKGHLLAEVLFEFTRNCSQRAFFLTKKGRVGLGPADLRQYDTIFAQRPLNPINAMRRTAGGRWKLIGDCYLYGWDRAELLTRRGKMETIE